MPRRVGRGVWSSVVSCRVVGLGLSGVWGRAREPLGWLVGPARHASRRSGWEWFCVRDGSQGPYPTARRRVGSVGRNRGCPDRGSSCLSGVQQ